MSTENNVHHRIVWLDVIRLVAMLMVIGVHCIDPFYISPVMRGNAEYTYWAAVYGSMFRPSVPLFVMMTGLLLLPYTGKSFGAFYKKRIFRVLFPFLIWSVLYNMFPWFTGILGLPKGIIGQFFCYTQGSESQSLVDSLKDVAMIPFNFSHKENHMWYIYLIIGMYLYIPFFSAWIEKADLKTKKIFLTIWGVSLFIPYLREFVGNMLFDRNSYIWGTDTWNEFGMFYYFAGFIGYLFMGYFVREGNDWSVKKTLCLSILMFAAGFYVTYTGFSTYAARPDATETEMELFFTFCSPNVLLMTLAVFLLLQKVRIENKRVISLLANMTKCGFGIYMVHYFIVGPFFLLIGPSSIPIPLQVPLMAVCIFFCSWAVTAAIYKIFPNKARYIMG